MYKGMLLFAAILLLSFLPIAARGQRSVPAYTYCQFTPYNPQTRSYFSEPFVFQEHGKVVTKAFNDYVSSKYSERGGGGCGIFNSLAEAQAKKAQDQAVLRTYKRQVIETGWTYGATAMPGSTTPQGATTVAPATGQVLYHFCLAGGATRNEGGGIQIRRVPMPKYVSDIYTVPVDRNLQRADTHAFEQFLAEKYDPYFRQGAVAMCGGNFTNMEAAHAAKQRQEGLYRKNAARDPRTFPNPNIIETGWKWRDDTATENVPQPIAQSQQPAVPSQTAPVSTALIPRRPGQSAGRSQPLSTRYGYCFAGQSTPRKLYFSNVFDSTELFSREMAASFYAFVQEKFPETRATKTYSQCIQGGNLEDANAMKKRHQIVQVPVIQTGWSYVSSGSASNGTTRNEEPQAVDTNTARPVSAPVSAEPPSQEPMRPVPQANQKPDEASSAMQYCQANELLGNFYDCPCFSKKYMEVRSSSLGTELARDGVVHQVPFINLVGKLTSDSGSRIHECLSGARIPPYGEQRCKISLVPITTKGRPANAWVRSYRKAI